MAIRFQNSICVLLGLIGAFSSHVGAQLPQQEPVQDIPSVSTSTTSSTTTTTGPCGGQCQNGGICIFEGSKSHSPTAEEEAVEGYRCACQPGYTGLFCAEPFLSCSNASPCQNKGVCTLGLRDDYDNEQYFCDCGDAQDEDGNSYVGKWCEHQAINYCNGSGDFCVNGECNLEYEEGNGPMCFCNEGHGGAHCEFSKGHVPKCDLDCQHGGHCILGETSNAPDIYHYWDTSENQGDQMHCRCPADYEGPLCQYRKSACGDGHCFNGSQCVEKIGTDEKAHFHCDCSQANTEDAAYAGRYCQYKATTYCETSPQYTGAPLFCVNNGRCKEDVYEGCDCDQPFTGFSCEFRMPSISPQEPTSAEAPQEPTSAEAPLTPAPIDSSSSSTQTHRPATDDPDYAACVTTCENGGICRKGAKDLGVLEQVSHDIGHLNQTSTEDFEHCVCPPGFTGVRCETKVEVCPQGEHLCLHGSKCVSDGEYHACDCSQTDGSEAHAGIHCQHKATTICTKGDLGPGKPLSFCTNSGTCKAMVTPEEPHAGCDCTGDWTGPHCELRLSSDPLQTAEPIATPSTNMNDNYSSSNSDADTDEASSGGGMLVVEIVFLALSLVLLAAGILYGMSMYIQHKKHQAAAAESVSFVNGQEPYRDEPNLSPHAKRDSVTDPFPSRFHSSSSDPFASVVGESTRQASRAPRAMEPVEIC